jgi:hypothetical protein
MSILGVKDSRRMEVVRYLDEDEDMYYSVLNRPVEDIEQRTKDLNKQLRPARAFEVHQTFPPSLNVQVAAGWYMSTGAAGTSDQQKPKYWPEAGDIDILAIPVAGAGTFRCDLICFHPNNGQLFRSQGSTEASWANAWTNRARVPQTTSGRIPLAYVYVDDSGTFFNDTIAVNNAGHIHDVRSAFGSGRRVWEEDPTVFRTDSSSPTHGSSFKLARADHKHPTKVTSVNPATLTPDGVATDGVDTNYAREDHRHPVTYETVGSNFEPDVAGGALGSENKFCRSDHQHPLNIQVSPVPTAVSAGILSDEGTSEKYSRLDHRHQVTGVTMDTQLWTVQFTNTDVETFAYCGGWDNWQWTWIIYSGNTSHAALNGGPRPSAYWNILHSGFAVYTPGIARATGMFRTHNGDETNTKLAVDFNSEGSNQIIGGSADHHAYYDIQNNIDEAPFDTDPNGYINYGAVWEFNTDPTVSGVAYGYNVKFTSWDQSLYQVGLTPNKPIWAEFNGVMVTQG